MTPTQRFTNDDRARIEQAIADAESKTSAEIVVAIAARSGRYDRAEDLFGLIFGLLVTLGAGLLVPRQPDVGEWTRGLHTDLQLPAILITFLVSTVIGAVLATRFPSLAPRSSARESGTRNSAEPER